MILRILKLCVDISKVIVLEGRLKFSVIEGRLRMPPAGMQRQCLRLGTACLVHSLTIQFYMLYKE